MMNEQKPGDAAFKAFLRDPTPRAYQQPPELNPDVLDDQQDLQTAEEQPDKAPAESIQQNAQNQRRGHKVLAVIKAGLGGNNQNAVIEP